MKEFFIHDVDVKCVNGTTAHGAVAKSTDRKVTITGEKEDVEKIVTALENFEKKEPQLQKSLEKAFRTAMKENPESFLAFFGMTSSPEIIEEMKNM